MSKTRFFAIICAFFFLSVLVASAQEPAPDINPTFTYDEEGTMYEATEYEGDAPLVLTFHVNAENVGAYREYYEWRFYKEGGSPENPYLVRSDTEETTVTFTESGAHCIVVYAYFINGTDTVKYDAETWSLDKTPLRVTIKESKLEFPNAFSPNNDGRNDIYRAKPGYQSIVSFKATIFNRWGQKLYEWTDPAGGWDGTFHGSPVKEGVYFVHVEAKGADGHVYDIRRDVNLLRNYTERNGGSATP